MVQRSARAHGCPLRPRQDGFHVLGLPTDSMGQPPSEVHVQTDPAVVEELSQPAGELPSGPVPVGQQDDKTPLPDHIFHQVGEGDPLVDEQDRRGREPQADEGLAVALSLHEQDRTVLLDRGPHLPQELEEVAESLAVRHGPTNGL